MTITLVAFPLAAAASLAAAAPPPAAPPVTVAEAPAAAPAKEGAAPVPAQPATSRARHQRRPISRAAARVEAARRAATREPLRESYLNALQVYPWQEGSLYRLHTAPEQVSDIVLQAGESLVSVAAGDTVRWVVGDTTSGTGSARRVHILVKPSAAGLATNLLIATDRRVYHLQLESEPRGAMASIAWTYPEDALLAVRAREAAAEAAPVAEGLDVARLNFSYVVQGDHPAWRPVRAFDDGRQVYIEFPPTLAAGEAPPLFVTGEGGAAELVNYRLRGRYYVVDRLFPAAELRLGTRHQEVVRIVRTDTARPQRRKEKRS